MFEVVFKSRAPLGIAARILGYQIKRGPDFELRPYEKLCLYVRFTSHLLSRLRFVLKLSWEHFWGLVGAYTV